MISFIDLNYRHKRIQKDITKNIACVLDHGQYIMCPEVKKLEDKLAVFVEAKHCIGVTSGTVAAIITPNGFMDKF